MKTKLLPLSLLLASCIYDPPTPRIEIVNNSEKDFVLELSFDSNAYKPYWSAHDFRVFLTYPYGHSYPGPEAKLVSFDTLRLVQIYKIPANATFSFEGWGTNNDSVLYNKMKIIQGSNTVVFYNLAQIKHAFKKVDEYTNRLELKEIITTNNNSFAQ